MTKGSKKSIPATERLMAATTAIATIKDRPAARPRIVMSRWRDLAYECTAREDELAAQEREFLGRILLGPNISRKDLETLTDIAGGLGIIGGAQ